MRRLAILGGSSPFTAALVDAIRACDGLEPHVLVLHGRAPRPLELVSRYAAHSLVPSGWQVFSTLDLPQAVAGACVVVHQIRYGGMEGRAASEDFCLRHGCPADETLGPGALLTGLLGMAELAETCRTLRAHAGDAWILNLTNPLSSVTAIMHGWGLKRCIGLCELPTVTVREAAGLYGLVLDQVDWGYVGLNHRGFIHRFRHGERDLLAELPDQLPGRTLGGVSADDVRELGALPLKYYPLLRRAKWPVSRRGLELIALRGRLYDQLEAHPDTSPSGLRERYLEWYPQAVVPMLKAIQQCSSRPQMVNAMRADGLVWEGRATIGHQDVTMLREEACEGKLNEILSSLCAHERAFLAALRNPAQRLVKAALAADPSVDPARAVALSDALWEEYRRRLP